MLQLLKIISRGTVQVLLIIHAPPGLGQEKLSKEAGDKKDTGVVYQLNLHHHMFNGSQMLQVLSFVGPK